MGHEAPLAQQVLVGRFKEEKEVIWVVEEKEKLVVVSRVVEGASKRGNPYFGMVDKNEKAYFIWDTELIEEAKTTIGEGSKVLITYEDRGDKPAVVTKFEVVGKEEVKEEPKAPARAEGINRRTALMQAVQMSELIARYATGYVSGAELLALTSDLVEAFCLYLETGSTERIRKVVSKLKEKGVVENG